MWLWRQDKWVIEIYNEQWNLYSTSFLLHLSVFLLCFTSNPHLFHLYSILNISAFHLYSTCIPSVFHHFLLHLVVTHLSFLIITCLPVAAITSTFPLTHINFLASFSPYYDYLPVLAIISRTSSSPLLSPPLFNFHLDSSQQFFLLS